MTIILHIDMNSFFASVEQAANHVLKGKPIVVGGGIKKSSVVAAAIYEAKAYGIKTAMPTWEAKKLCPHLIVIIGDMTKYIYTSRELRKIFVEYTDLVEMFSIDEAFVDVTRLVAEKENPWVAAIQIAQEIKNKIRKRFNLTCTIGVGANKTCQYGLRPRPWR